MAGPEVRRAIGSTLLCLGATSVGAADAPGSGGSTVETNLSFSLPAAAITSAGVYNKKGQLLRTLWRAEKLAAGDHLRLAAWDGRNDNGQPVTDAEVDVRLIQHQVSYAWEGVIGNSSGSFGGPNIHKSFLPPSAIAIGGDRVFYATGYNEWQPGLHAFSATTPERNVPFAQTNDAFVSHAMVAVDANRLYWANVGGISRTTFVGAFELTTSKPGVFSAGVPVCLNYRPNSKQCYEDQDYPNVIDLRTEAAAAPTGLAVQRDGRVLAVAHGGENLIRLFDKTSGAAIGQISLPLVAKALNQLAMTRSGDLWVISGNSVLRYTDLERTPQVATRIDGLEAPLALGASPGSDETLWVADGGASQQLKRFDRSGAPGPVIGVRGGYANSPAVAANKLCFQARDGKQQTAVAVAADASLWVVDYCNNRMLRFRTTGTGVGNSDAQVAYLPASYTATVDHGNPRRVYANFLEFEVDNTGPLVAGKSWKLVRNWLAGLPASLVDDRSFNGAFGGFTSVETLSNRRTYGILMAQGRQVIVELPASGPLRVVKVLAKPMQGATWKVLYENGDLGYALTGSSTQSVLRLPITGFDGAGDPVWASDPVTLASAPTLPGTPYYRGAFSGMPPRFPVTASGNITFFDQSITGNEGFHLGATGTGGKEWLWQASPSGALDGKGSFQTKRVDQSINYGGNAVWASGRHIVYGYHGEFYKDMSNGRVGQANQFMHFDESGLFIGQFGQPSTQPTQPSQAGLSGNAFSPTLVRDGTRLYLYHNDESTHGGVHRWRIDGADGIRELRGRGPNGGLITLR